MPVTPWKHNNFGCLWWSDNGSWRKSICGHCSSPDWRKISKNKTDLYRPVCLALAKAPSACVQNWESDNIFISQPTDSSCWGRGCMRSMRMPIETAKPLQKLYCKWLKFVTWPGHTPQRATSINAIDLTVYRTSPLAPDKPLISTSVP